MSKEQLKWDYIFLRTLHLIYLLSQMQIGWGELQRDDPLLAIVHSLEEILSHGVQKNSTQFSGQAQKQNIA
jgi:hypothetical protein